MQLANPLGVEDFPLELLSTKLHLEKASLLEKRRNLKTFIIRCPNFITQNGLLKIKMLLIVFFM